MLVGYLVMCVIFGTTFVAIKVGLGAGFPPLFFAALRFIIAGLLALGLSRVRGQALPRSSEQYRQIALVGLTSTTITFAGLFWSEQYLTAGMAAILSATAPMLVMLVATGGRLGRAQLLSVAGGLAGVGLVMAPTVGQGSSMALVAAAGLIASYLGHAWGSVRAGAVMKSGLQPLPFSGLQMLFGGIGLLAAAALFELRHLPMVAPEGWLALLYLAVIGSVVGWGLYYWLVARTGPVFPSTWTYVSPVLATAAGAWFLAEPVSPATLAGVTLVLASVALTDPKAARRLLPWLRRPAEAAGD